MSAGRLVSAENLTSTERRLLAANLASFALARILFSGAMLPLLLRASRRSAERVQDQARQKIRRLAHRYRHDG